LRATDAVDIFWRDILRYAPPMASWLPEAGSFRRAFDFSMVSSLASAAAASLLPSSAALAGHFFYFA